MPYQAGTATNLQDLLNKLGTFAGANGWTVHFSGARTGGAGSTGHALILSRGDVQGILRSNNSAGSPGLNPGPYLEALLWSGAYNSASTESQPQVSAVSDSNWMAGPYVAYHVYTNASGTPYFHVVVEVTSGIFRHFGIGQLRRFGAFTNGCYAYGTCMAFATSPAYINTANSFHGYPFNGSNQNSYGGNTLVRADFDGVSPRYCQAGAFETTGRLHGGYMQGSAFPSSGQFNVLANSGVSAFTGRAALLPLLVFAQREATDNLRHPLGFPEDMRYVSVDNFQPGDTITLGSETWQVFPVVRKGSAVIGPVGVQNSWRYGLAYRVVA